MRGFELITDPVAYMQSIDENPRFLRIITVNVTGYLFVILMMWIFSAEEIFQSSAIPLDMDNVAVLNNYRILSVLTVFITFMAAPFIKAFFIGIQMPLYRTELIYKKTLCVVFSALIVVVLGELVYLLPRILLSDPAFDFSLKQLRGDNLAAPLQVILAYFDLFTIWFQILTIIGVKAITGLSSRQSAQIVLLPVALMLLLTIL